MHDGSRGRQDVSEPNLAKILNYRIDIYSRCCYNVRVQFHSFSCGADSEKGVWQ